ncbi:YncE family protein [Acidianus sp. HS-5]|uniref:YncE family protein n=1 Tax=Acidianus sp. HS-5 TaxID=2886040 RepID=UPI001F39E3C3|nr:YncE family protein [Acidianus sp. HS-5]BDC17119.1 hypothetical protein HS5_00090 [Acidianus sp. HS-5]
MIVKFLVLALVLISLSSSIVSIKVGNSPSFVLCNSGYIYVTNYNSSTVSVINPSNNDVVSTISVGAKPIDMINVGKKIYVSLTGCNKIDVIEDGKVINTINLPSIPYYMAYDCKDNEVFVLEPGIESIAIIENCTVVRTMNLGYSPYAIAFDPKDCLLYIGSCSNVYVYNTNLKLNKTCNVGGEIAYINFCRRNIFITSWKTNELIIINSHGTFRFSAGIDPYDAIYVGEYIYVSDIGSGSILVLTTSGKVVDNISVGGRPSIMMYKDGYIYIVNSLSNTVFVISQVTPPSRYCLYYLIAGGIAVIAIVGYFILKREIK